MNCTYIHTQKVNKKEKHEMVKDAAVRDWSLPCPALPSILASLPPSASSSLPSPPCCQLTTHCLPPRIYVCVRPIVLPLTPPLPHLQPLLASLLSFYLGLFPPHSPCQIKLESHFCKIFLPYLLSLTPLQISPSFYCLTSLTPLT